MQPSRRVAAVAVALALQAFAFPAVAATATTLPVTPGVADTVILQADVGGPRCPVVQPDGLSMTGNAIRVEVGEAPHCNAAPFSRFTVTLGRFPAGEYRVTVFERSAHSAGIGSAMLAETTFAVGSYGSAQLENMTGHWTTDVVGEGVSITQIGARLFFTWLAYGPDGRATWMVAPDAGYQLKAGKGGKFAGPLYSARGAAPKGVSGLPFTPFADIAVSGSASIAATGVDTATMELRLEDGHEISRTLRRMRF